MIFQYLYKTDQWPATSIRLNSFIDLIVNEFIVLGRNSFIEISIYTVQTSTHSIIHVNICFLIKKMFYFYFNFIFLVKFSKIFEQTK